MQRSQIGCYDVPSARPRICHIIRVKSGTPVAPSRRHPQHQTDLNFTIIVLSSIKMRVTHLEIAFTACLLAGFLHGASCAFSPEHDFSRAHSYSSNTSFDARDGWKRVTITDLSYKYLNQSITPAQQQTFGLASHSRRRSKFGHIFDRRATKVKTASKRKTPPKKSSKAASNAKASSDIVKDADVGSLLNQAMKGIGKATSVVVTWYTRAPDRGTSKLDGIYN